MPWRAGKFVIDPLLAAADEDKRLPVGQVAIGLRFLSWQLSALTNPIASKSDRSSIAGAGTTYSLCVGRLRITLKSHEQVINLMDAINEQASRYLVKQNKKIIADMLESLPLLWESEYLEAVQNFAVWCGDCVVITEDSYAAVKLAEKLNGIYRGIMADVYGEVADELRTLLSTKL